MAKQTGKKQFSCSDCQRTFRWSSQFKMHSCAGQALQRDRSHEKKHGYCRCSKCGETFSNRTLLWTHKRNHQQVFTCSVCRTEFRFFSQLKIHMRKHTGEKPYSCPTCGKKFSQKGITKEHMLTHAKVRPFSCTTCGKTFSWRYQIKRHKCVSMSELIKNLDSERSLKRKVSLDGEDSDFWKETRHHQSGVTYQRNKDFSSVKEFIANKKPLNHHDKKNGSKNNKDNDNNSCRQSSLNEIKDVSLGAAGSHPEKELLTFLEISTRSQKSHTMKIHVRDFTREKPFSRPSCGKRVVTGGHLTKHLPTHKGEKHLSCTDCEKTFPSESELLSHECQQESLQHHQTEKQKTSSGQFSCPYCNKKFVLKEQLQIHMRRHTNRLRCLLCSESFATQEDLTFHFERHTSCSVCNAVFDDRDSLVQHMRSHTGQTQFCCFICGQDFEWRRQLTRHMQVHKETGSSRDRVDPVNRQDSEQKRAPRKMGFQEEKGVYICSVCQRGFSCQSDLSHHQCVNQFLQIHFNQTETGEENEQTGGEDFEGPELTGNSKADGALLLKFEDEASESSDPDTDDSDFWKETKICQSSNTSLKRKVFECAKGFNTNEVKPQRDDSDFWKETKVSDSGLTSEVQNDIFLKKENEDIQQFSSRDLSQHKKICTEMQQDVKEEEPEPPQIKEEQQEAAISEFTFSLVSVKTEDDEEKPQSFQVYDTHTENIDSVGTPESGKNTDLDFRGMFVKTDESADRDFWKDTTLNSETDSCGNPVSGPDDKVPEDLHPESDDSVDSDFWKSNRKPQPLLNTNDTEASDTEASHGNSQKPYKCKECGKRFALICHMNNHMQQHTEKRKFWCSICGRGYPYKSLWENHMRSHTGEKPFSCPVCGKKYSYKATMQSHMISHTVDNKYSCDICGKSFAWYTELKYHECVSETTH